MLTNKLRVTELDFDGIKENLKQFLSSDDSLFKVDGGFNFEGSVLSSLLDVLAYNTHYMGYYTNMLANEMFLDSAVKRESVVSLAKQLGYTPRSATCAQITFNATNIDDNNSITLSTNKLFEGENDESKTFKFYPIDEYVIQPGQTASITCQEGSKITREYISDSNSLNQKFLLDSNVDKFTLEVRVKPENTSDDNTFVTYNEFEDITALLQTGASLAKVYYLNEVEAGQFEVVFGDGVETGYRPTDGSLIELRYLVSSLDEPNGISQIREASTVAVLEDIQVTSVASGGSEPQSLESIRYMAPKSFQSQNRAVTSDDYTTLSQNKFPNLKSVISWGGEENDPVAYGKVFISIWKKDNALLTESEKEWVKTDMLKRNKVIGIIPEVVDPDFIYMKVNTEVLYDSSSALIPAGSIMNKVSSSIYNYGQVNLDSFGQSFRFSPLATSIDNSDSAIVSNYLQLSLYKKVTPSVVSGQLDSWEFNFNTALDSVSSDYFVTPVYSNVKFVETDGVLNLVDLNGQVVKTAVGTVSDNGKVEINPIEITSTSDITFTSTIDQKDVELLKGQVMVIDKNDIDVVMRRA